jgi:hypothetical protein
MRLDLLSTAQAISFLPTSPGRINLPARTSLIAAAIRGVAVPASQKILLLVAWDRIYTTKQCLVKKCANLRDPGTNTKRLYIVFAVTSIALSLVVFKEQKKEQFM